jgi:hypothetical protein
VLGCEDLEVAYMQAEASFVETRTHEIVETNSVENTAERDGLIRA